MTVQQLIDALMEVEDKGQIVVLSRDAEGNGFRPLDHMEHGTLRYQEEYLRGDVTENPRQGVPCALLWPID